MAFFLIFYLFSPVAKLRFRMFSDILLYHGKKQVFNTHVFSWQHHKPAC